MKRIISFLSIGLVICSASAHAISDLWGTGITFRADFALPTDFVSIDVIPNNSLDPATLSAFNSADTLLTSFTTTGTTGVGNPETASITWGAADISYVTVSSSPHNYGLDNLQAGIISVDPDAFASGTDISSAYSGVTLSTSGLNPPVFSVTSSLASTGTRAFGNEFVVPIPAAVWLFGSGLLGLIGIARRKKAA